MTIFNSLCNVCLSAAKSHKAGGARPVSDSLIPYIDKNKRVKPLRKLIIFKHWPTKE